ncbi:MAG: hypothetical protein ACW9XA_05240 [Candidatus Nitrosopumilus sp. bin_6a]
METAKIPKFKWSELPDLNFSHTPNEWGMKKRKSNQFTLVSYTVSWDD